MTVCRVRCNVPLRLGPLGAGHTIKAGSSASNGDWENIMLGDSGNIVFAQCMSGGGGGMVFGIGIAELSAGCA